MCFKRIFWIIVKKGAPPLTNYRRPPFHLRLACICLAKRFFAFSSFIFAERPTLYILRWLPFLNNIFRYALLALTIFHMLEICFRPFESRVSTFCSLPPLPKGVSLGSTFFKCFSRNWCTIRLTLRRDTMCCAVAFSPCSTRKLSQMSATC